MSPRAGGWVVEDPPTSRRSIPGDPVLSESIVIFVVDVTLSTNYNLFCFNLLIYLLDLTTPIPCNGTT